MDFNRGDLVWANLDPAKPGEQGRTRPCIIVSYNALNHSKHPCVIVCPITGVENVHAEYPTHTLLPAESVPGIVKDSIIMAEQVRTISRSRIDEDKGNTPIPVEVMSGVDKTLKRVLSLEE